ncbi:MAG: peptide chain release factor N(5)-glutamine methyltransferase [Clostridia bacterium]|nr:peptide chain release factor N(5)-glutamine methyltransferase [Clostridia bacterium]
MKRIRDLYEEGVAAIATISPAPEADVKRLLLHFCQVTALDLIIDKDKMLSDEAVEAYEKALAKRVAGDPVQYITNEETFMGLSFYVDARVLIPRDETELLVERVLMLLKERQSGSLVMDIGVGSGAICLSVAKLGQVGRVYGIDISKDALDVARHNAKQLEVEESVTFIESDLFTAVPKDILGSLDILISNPPYIPPEEMEVLHEDVKREPSLALYGGEDGLKFYRAITEAGWDYLKPDGILVYEVGHDQGERVGALMLDRGFRHVEYIEDYQGFKRVVIGYKL